jgi:hypothetical protein
VIHYNERITLRGIPLEAYRYTLGSRSAIESIIDPSGLSSAPCSLRCARLGPEADGKLTDRSHRYRESRLPALVAKR